MSYTRAGNTVPTLRMGTDLEWFGWSIGVPFTTSGRCFVFGDTQFALLARRGTIKVLVAY